MMADEWMARQGDGPLYCDLESLLDGSLVGLAGDIIIIIIIIEGPILSSIA